MATTNRIYILAAFFLSGIACILNIVSLSTENWITGRMTGSFSSDNHVNYGLFNGNYITSIPTPSSFQIGITCDFSYNVCAMLCGNNKIDILKGLLGQSVNNETYSCASTSTMILKFSPSFTTVSNNRGVDTQKFINAGVWLSTVVCIILAIAIGVATTVLALFNSISNPVQFYLGVESLFFYNGLAVGFTLLYIILWGALYNIRILHNVALYETLEPGLMSSDKMAFLGYSYWISFVSLTLYSASIGILLYREHLNTKDPNQNVVNLDDSTDPNIYLY